MVLDKVIASRLYHNVAKYMGQSIQERTMLKQTMSLQIFKGCLPQVLHGPFLNTLSYKKL